MKDVKNWSNNLRMISRLLLPVFRSSALTEPISVFSIILLRFLGTTLFLAMLGLLSMLKSLRMRPWTNNNSQLRCKDSLSPGLEHGMIWLKYSWRSWRKNIQPITKQSACLGLNWATIQPGMDQKPTNYSEAQKLVSDMTHWWSYHDYPIHLSHTLSN